jgi:long-chain acyl-CoA synthetase
MPWLSPEFVNEQSEILVGRLVGCGLSSIGILAENSIDWALLELAATRAGICRVPLPTFFSDAQLAHILASARIDALFTDKPKRARRLSSNLDLSPSPLPGLDFFRHCGGAHEVAEFATVTFTSGTTGEPKGVCLHQPQLDAVVSILSRVVPMGKHLTLMPMSTLLETTAGLHMALRRGAPVFIPNADSANIVETLLATGAQTAITTPAILQQIVDEGEHLPALRFLAVGGAPVPWQLLADSAALGLPVYEGYGFSEAGSVVSLNSPDGHRTGSSGRLLPHCEVRIDEGEIVLCDHQFGGYLGESPYSGDWYTGDDGYLDEDGYLHVYGRRGDVLVTAAGRNVSRGWLRNTLAAAGAKHVEIRERAGQLEATLSANSAKDARRIIATANSQLPAYAHLTHGHITCPSSHV